MSPAEVSRRTLMVAQLKETIVASPCGRDAADLVVVAEDELGLDNDENAIHEAAP